MTEPEGGTRIHLAGQPRFAIVISGKVAIGLVAAVIVAILIVNRWQVSALLAHERHDTLVSRCESKNDNSAKDEAKWHKILELAGPAPNGRENTLRNDFIRFVDATDRPLDCRHPPNDLTAASTRPTT